MESAVHKRERGEYKQAASSQTSPPAEQSRVEQNGSSASEQTAHRTTRPASSSPGVVPTSSTGPCPAAVCCPCCAFPLPNPDNQTLGKTLLQPLEVSGCVVVPASRSLRLRSALVGVGLAYCDCSLLSPIRNLGPPRNSLGRKGIAPLAPIQAGGGFCGIFIPRIPAPLLPPVVSSPSARGLGT